MFLEGLRNLGGGGVEQPKPPPRYAGELYSFLTLVLGGGGWSTPRPGRFPPGRENYIG